MFNKQLWMNEWPLARAVNQITIFVPEVLFCSYTAKKLWARSNFQLFMFLGHPSPRVSLERPLYLWGVRGHSKDTGGRPKDTEDSPKIQNRSLVMGSLVKHSIWHTVLMEPPRLTSWGWDLWNGAKAQFRMEKLKERLQMRLPSKSTITKIITTELLDRREVETKHRTQWGVQTQIEEF